MRSVRNSFFIHLFAISVLFAVLASVVAYLYLGRAIHSNVLQNHRRSVEAIRDNIGRTFATQKQFLDQLASFDGISPFSESRARQTLKQFLRLDHMYGTVHYYAADGRLLVAEKRSDFPKYHVEKSVGAHDNTEFQKLFAKVVSTKAPIFSSTFYSARHSHYYTYLVPVFYAKEVVGVLSAALFPTIHPFDSFLTGLTLSSENFLMVVDKEENLISSYNIGSDWIDHILEKPQLTAEPQGSTEQKITHGKNAYYLVSTELNGSPNYKIIMGISDAFEKEAFAVFLKYIVLVFVAAILMALFSSGLVAQEISKPLHYLISRIRELDKGRSELPLKNYADDFRVAEDALNSLEKKIKKSETLASVWLLENEKHES